MAPSTGELRATFRPNKREHPQVHQEPQNGRARRCPLQAFKRLKRQNPDLSSR